jgi:hypothetical protein
MPWFIWLTFKLIIYEKLAIFKFCSFWFLDYKAIYSNNVFQMDELWSHNILMRSPYFFLLVHIILPWTLYIPSLTSNWLSQDHNLQWHKVIKILRNSLWLMHICFSLKINKPWYAISLLTKSIYFSSYWEWYHIQYIISRLDFLLQKGS